jgi:tight adherence protein B
MSGQIVTVLAALMVFAAGTLVYVGYRMSVARASSPEMEIRLDRYAGIGEDVQSESTGRASALVTERIDRAVKNKTFAEQAQTALVRADLRMTVGEFLAMRGLTTLAGIALGIMFGRGAPAVGIIFALVAGILGWMAPSFYLRLRAKRRTRAFVNQLGDTIGLMANSLRAGYSLLQTMELVSRESPSPIGDEFRRVVREVGLGVSPQQALNNLHRRIPSEDLDLMVSAINIQHEIGGNLGQILDVIGETIRERVRIQGEISVLTAQQALTGNIITAMPVVLAFALYLMNPEYMKGMLVMPWICIPIGATVLLVIGYIVMRKIMAIEV